MELLEIIEKVENSKEDLLKMDITQLTMWGTANGIGESKREIRKYDLALMLIGIDILKSESLFPDLEISIPEFPPPFDKEDIKKMNFLICDRLNGIILNEDAPAYQLLSDSEEAEQEYGYMEKCKVNYELYQEYIWTLSIEDVKNIYKEFWHEEIPVRKNFQWGITNV